MKIRTKIEVSYNAPGAVTGQETGIVEGVIINSVWDNDFDRVGANYAYIRPVDGVVINKGAFTVSGEDVETLYNAIEPSIPTDQDHRTTEATKYYLAFIIEMANTFSIDASNIELVP